MEPSKILTLVAMATKFGLGAEIQSPIGFCVCLSVITPKDIKIFSASSNGQKG